MSAAFAWKEISEIMPSPTWGALGVPMMRTITPRIAADAAPVTRVHHSLIDQAPQIQRDMISRIFERQRYWHDSGLVPKNSEIQVDIANAAGVFETVKHNLPALAERYAGSRDAKLSVRDWDRRHALGEGRGVGPVVARRMLIEHAAPTHAFSGTLRRLKRYFSQSFLLKQVAELIENSVLVDAAPAASAPAIFRTELRHAVAEPDSGATHPLDTTAILRIATTRQNLLPEIARIVTGIAQERPVTFAVKTPRAFYGYPVPPERESYSFDLRPIYDAAG